LARQLRDVDKDVAALERRRGRLLTDLDGAGTDVAELVRVGTDLVSVEAELAAAEQRWLELSEAIDSGP
jgi:hypothetical protein